MKPVKKMFHLVYAENIITYHAFYVGNNNLKKARILSFGVNQMGDSEGKHRGIHAEYDSINKLMTIKNKKNLIKINLLVIRLSPKNKIQSSKPCVNCIEAMKTFPEKKGYKIENVYYSNEDGKIIKSNLRKLDADEKHYSMYFRRKANNV